MYISLIEEINKILCIKLEKVFLQIET